MPPYYSRKGDDSSTGLPGGDRLPKHHPLLETLGTLDEASAALGLARSVNPSSENQALLAAVQRDLYTLMAEVAAANPGNSAPVKRLDEARLVWLENQLDILSARVPAIKEFILPGDTHAGAALALARTVVRRAERRTAELLDGGLLKSELMLPYLNRLSSFCFVLELEANHAAGQKTTTARKAQADPE